MVGDVNSLFENLVWMITKEAASYLRKFTASGDPSVGAIRTAVCRGHLVPRKWRGRLYFNRRELDIMLNASLNT